MKLRLVRAATFGEMRAKAATQAPDPAGVLRDPAAFSRRGRPGAGHEVLTPAEVERYHARAATLAPSDLLDWLHRGSRSTRAEWNAQRPGISQVNYLRTRMP